MMKIIVLVLSYVAVWLKLLKPGGFRALVAENILLRQQLIALSRQQKRAPRLTFFDKLSFGMLASMISAKRLSRIAIAIKPATLLKFHKALVKRKYQWFFSNKSPKKPGPKGPEQAIINVIVEMKQQNPSYGYRRIAMQVSNSFGVSIDKDVVRRVLTNYYKNHPESTGPSWLTFIGHMKDSLWSVDLFRCESIHLKTHWVMTVMDQFTRRIIGFSVHAGTMTGIDLCCLFNRIISKKSLPKYLSSDNDPLFQFKRWQANLSILDIEEIKTVPYVPTSHPFIERLIGTVRRELLDKTLFFSANDLQNKLESFQHYYNEKRCHGGINGITPEEKAGEQQSSNVVSLNHYRWEKHCRGLFQLPVAA
jgi:putative transposase